MTPLRSSMIRLAHSNESLRPHLLPLLKEAMDFDTPEALAKYLKDHPGADKSNHHVKKQEAAPAGDDGHGKKHKTVLHKALHHTMHMVTEPFHVAKKLWTSPEARKNLKDSFKKAFHTEAKETKHLGQTIKDALSGKAISEEDRSKAINQTADLAKVALGGVFLHHLAGYGIKKFLASVATPLDEVIGVLIDKPIRKITKKVFGQEHGLMPSAFYGVSMEPAKAASRRYANEDEVMDKVMDTILDEMGKVDFSDDDVLAALAEVGLDEAKAKKLAEMLKKG